MQEKFDRLKLTPIYTGTTPEIFANTDASTAKPSTTTQNSTLTIFGAPPSITSAPTSLSFIGGPKFPSQVISNMLSVPCAAHGHSTRVSPNAVQFGSQPRRLPAAGLLHTTHDNWTRLFSATRFLDMMHGYQIYRFPAAKSHLDVASHWTSHLSALLSSASIGPAAFQPTGHYIFERQFLLNNLEKTAYYRLHHPYAGAPIPSATSATIDPALAYTTPMNNWMADLGNQPWQDTLAALSSNIRPPKMERNHLAGWPRIGYSSRPVLNSLSTTTVVATLKDYIIFVTICQNIFRRA